MHPQKRYEIAAGNLTSVASSETANVHKGANSVQKVVAKASHDSTETTGCTPTAHTKPDTQKAGKAQAVVAAAGQPTLHSAQEATSLGPTARVQKKSEFSLVKRFG